MTPESGRISQRGSLLLLLVATVLSSGGRSIAQPHTNGEKALAGAQAEEERGVRLLETGKLQQAQASFERLLELSKAPAMRAFQASAYGNLGLVYRGLGDAPRAEEAYRKAIELDELLGNKRGVANHSANLAALYQFQLKDSARAQALYERAIELEREIGREDVLASHYLNLGSIHRERGEFVHARPLLEQALALADKLGRKDMLAEAHGGLGLVASARGDANGAITKLAKAVTLYEEASKRDKLAAACRVLAAEYGKRGKRGDLANAERYFSRALEVNSELGRTEDVATEHANLGLIAMRLKKPAEARDHLGKAARLFDRLGRIELRARVEALLRQLGE